MGKQPSAIRISTSPAAITRPTARSTAKAARAVRRCGPTGTVMRSGSAWVWWHSPGSPAGRGTPEVLALVLGGGNALGAYHGGIVEVLANGRIWPDWVAGSSIGGITGALLA